MARKRATASSVRQPNILLLLLLFPLRLLRLIFQGFQLLFWLLVLAAILAIPTFVALIFAHLLIVDILFGLFDLIFRLDVRGTVLAWEHHFAETTLQPFFSSVSGQIVAWSDRLGITAILFKTSSVASSFATEAARAIVLFLVFLLLGFAIYHTRIVRRIAYAFTELAVAFVAVWIAIDGMSGGDFSLKYFIALISGLYVMVRGLQNMDHGLHEWSTHEKRNKIPNGPAMASLKIWTAVFYGPYEMRNMASRRDEVVNGIDKIIAYLRAKRQKKLTANAETMVAKAQRSGSRRGKN